MMKLTLDPIFTRWLLYQRNKQRMIPKRGKYDFRESSGVLGRLGSLKEGRKTQS